jgi:hypothetical protein
LPADAPPLPRCAPWCGAGVWGGPLMDSQRLSELTLGLVALAERRRREFWMAEHMPHVPRACADPVLVWRPCAVVWGLCGGRGLLCGVCVGRDPCLPHRPPPPTTTNTTAPHPPPPPNPSTPHQHPAPGEGGGSYAGCSAHACVRAVCLPNPSPVERPTTHPSASAHGSPLRAQRRYGRTCSRCCPSWRRWRCGRPASTSPSVGRRRARGTGSGRGMAAACPAVSPPATGRRRPSGACCPLRCGVECLCTRGGGAGPRGCRAGKGRGRAGILPRIFPKVLCGFWRVVCVCGGGARDACRQGPNRRSDVLAGWHVRRKRNPVPCKGGGCPCACVGPRPGVHGGVGRGAQRPACRPTVPLVRCAESLRAHVWTAFHFSSAVHRGRLRVAAIADPLAACHEAPVRCAGVFLLSPG